MSDGIESRGERFAWVRASTVAAALVLVVCGQFGLDNGFRYMWCASTSTTTGQRQVF